MSVDAYGEFIKAFIDQLPPKASVIDLACGPGNFAGYALQYRHDLNWLGVDGSKKMIQYAMNHFHTAEFKVEDCRLLNFKPKIYSAAVCSFLLPYLKQDEAKQLLRSIHKGLINEGLLYISTTLEAGTIKNASPSKMQLPNYHSKNQIQMWLDEAGFKINSSNLVINKLNRDIELILLVKKL